MALERDTANVQHITSTTKQHLPRTAKTGINIWVGRASALEDSRCIGIVIGLRVILECKSKVQAKLATRTFMLDLGLPTVSSELRRTARLTGRSNFADNLSLCC